MHIRRVFALLESKVVLRGLQILADYFRVTLGYRSSIFIFLRQPNDANFLRKLI